MLELSKSDVTTILFAQFCLLFLVISGNVKENAWDEILQAFSAKKANLSNEVRWRTGEKKAWEGAHDP